MERRVHKDNSPSRHHHCHSQSSSSLLSHFITINGAVPFFLVAFVWIDESILQVYCLELEKYLHLQAKLLLFGWSINIMNIIITKGSRHLLIDLLLHRLPVLRFFYLVAIFKFVANYFDLSRQMLSA